MVQGFMSGTCAILIQDNDVIATIEDGLDPELWGVGNIPIGTSGFGTQTAGYGGKDAVSGRDCKVHQVPVQRRKQWLLLPPEWSDPHSYHKYRTR